MCIDDELLRFPFLLSLNTNSRTFVLNLTRFDGLKKIELYGYQSTGVPVIAGLPYSSTFFIEIAGGCYSLPLVSDRDSAIAALGGYPISINAAETYTHYDTPLTIATIDTLFPGLQTTKRFTINIRDITNQPAQFTNLVLYFNLVYDTKAKVDIDKSAKRTMVISGQYAEHSKSLNK